MIYWLLLSKQNWILWLYLNIELNPSSLKLLWINKIYTIWLHRHTNTLYCSLLPGLHFSWARMTQCSISPMLLLHSVILLPERHARRIGVLYNEIFTEDYTWVLISYVWLFSSLPKLYNHCRRPDEEARVRRELLMLIALEKSVLPKTTPALKHTIRSI